MTTFEGVAETIAVAHYSQSNFNAPMESFLPCPGNVGYLPDRVPSPFQRQAKKLCRIFQESAGCSAGHTDRLDSSVTVNTPEISFNCRRAIMLSTACSRTLRT